MTWRLFTVYGFRSSEEIMNTRIHRAHQRSDEQMEVYHAFLTCHQRASPTSGGCNLVSTLPAILGRQSVNDLDRELLTLPAWLEGLGIPILTENANYHYSACTTVMAPLVDLICHQQHDYPIHTRLEQRHNKSSIHTSNCSETVTKVNTLKSTTHTQARGWSKPVRRAHHPGSPGAFHWPSWASNCTNRPSEMPSAKGMVGHQWGSPHTAHVGIHSMWTMPSVVPTEQCQPYDTMAAGTSLFNSSLRFAQTWVSSLHCSPSVERACVNVVATQRMGPD